MSSLILVEETYLTFEDTAIILNVSLSYLRSLVEQGELPVYEIDSLTKFKKKDVLNYKESEDAKRLLVLDELTAQAQELNMGY